MHGHLQTMSRTQSFPSQLFFLEDSSIHENLHSLWKKSSFTETNAWERRKGKSHWTYSSNPNDNLINDQLFNDLLINDLLINDLMVIDQLINDQLINNQLINNRLVNVINNLLFNDQLINNLLVNDQLINYQLVNDQLTDNWIPQLNSRILYKEMFAIFSKYFFVFQEFCEFNIFLLIF